MSGMRYTDEFRVDAVKQIIERGFEVVEVVGRLGLPKHTLYEWVQTAKKDGKAESAVLSEKSAPPRSGA